MTTLEIILSDVDFKNKVLNRSKTMGADGALYFTIGEFQSKNNDQDDEYFLDDEPIDAIIKKYPELEF